MIGEAAYHVYTFRESLGLYWGTCEADAISTMLKGSRAAGLTTADTIMLRKLDGVPLVSSTEGKEVLSDLPGVCVGCRHKGWVADRRDGAHDVLVVDREGELTCGQCHIDLSQR